MKRVTPSLRNASFVRMSAILIGLTAIVPGCADTAKEAVTPSTADLADYWPLGLRDLIGRLTVQDHPARTQLV